MTLADRVILVKTILHQLEGWVNKGRNGDAARNQTTHTAVDALISLEKDWEKALTHLRKVQQTHLLPPTGQAYQARLNALQQRLKSELGWYNQPERTTLMASVQRRLFDGEKEPLLNSEQWLFLLSEYFKENPRYSPQNYEYNRGLEEHIQAFKRNGFRQVVQELLDVRRDGRQAVAQATLRDRQPVASTVPRTSTVTTAQAPLPVQRVQSISAVPPVPVMDPYLNRNLPYHRGPGKTTVANPQNVVSSIYSRMSGANPSSKLGTQQDPIVIGSDSEGSSDEVQEVGEQPAATRPQPVGTTPKQTVRQREVTKTPSLLTPDNLPPISVSSQASSPIRNATPDQTAASSLQASPPKTGQSSAFPLPNDLTPNLFPSPQPPPAVEKSGESTSLFPGLDRAEKAASKPISSSTPVPIPSINTKPKIPSPLQNESNVSAPSTISPNPYTPLTPNRPGEEESFDTVPMQPNSAEGIPIPFNFSPSPYQSPGTAKSTSSDLESLFPISPKAPEPTEPSERVRTPSQRTSRQLFGNDPSEPVEARSPSVRSRSPPKQRQDPQVGLAEQAAVYQELLEGQLGYSIDDYDHGDFGFENSSDRIIGQLDPVQALDVPNDGEQVAANTSDTSTHYTLPSYFDGSPRSPLATPLASPAREAVKRTSVPSSPLAIPLQEQRTSIPSSPVREIDSVTKTPERPELEDQAQAAQDLPAAPLEQAQPEQIPELPALAGQPILPIAAKRTYKTTAHGGAGYGKGRQAIVPGQFKKGFGQAFKTAEDIEENYGKRLAPPIPYDASFGEPDVLLPRGTIPADAEDNRAKYIKAVLGIDPNELPAFADEVARQTISVSQALKIAGNRALANLLKLVGLEDYRLGKVDHGLSERDIVDRLVKIKKTLEIGEEYLTSVAPLPQIYALLNRSLQDPKNAPSNSIRRRIYQRPSPLRNYANSQDELTSTLPQDILPSFNFIFSSKNVADLPQQQNVEKALFLNWSLYYLENVDASERSYAGIDRPTNATHYATLRSLLNKRVLEGTGKVAAQSGINIRDDRELPEGQRRIPDNTVSVENAAIAASRGLVALQHVPGVNEVPGFQPQLDEYVLPTKASTYSVSGPTGQQFIFRDNKTKDSITRRPEDIINTVRFPHPSSPPKKVLVLPAQSIAEEFGNGDDSQLRQAVEGLTASQLNEMLVQDSLASDIFSGPQLEADFSPSTVKLLMEFGEGDPSTDLPLPRLAEPAPAGSPLSIPSLTSPAVLDESRTGDRLRRNEVRVASAALDATAPSTPVRTPRKAIVHSSPGSADVLTSPVRRVHVALPSEAEDLYTDFSGPEVMEYYDEPSVVLGPGGTGLLEPLDEVIRLQNTDTLRSLRDEVQRETSPAESVFPINGLAHFSDVLESPPRPSPAFPASVPAIPASAPATPVPKRVFAPALIPSPNAEGYDSSLRSSRSRSKKGGFTQAVSDVFERVRNVLSTANISNKSSKELFSTIPDKDTFEDTVRRIMNHVEKTKELSLPIYLPLGSGETSDDRKDNERAISNFQDTTLAFFSNVYNRLKKKYPKGTTNKSQEALHLQTAVLQIYRAWYEKNKNTFEEIIRAKDTNKEGYLIFQHFKLQLDLVLQGHAHLVRHGDQWSTIEQGVAPTLIPVVSTSTSTKNHASELRTEKRVRKAFEAEEDEDEETVAKRGNPDDA